MKKFLKNNIKLILVFLLGIVISSGITAYAVNNYMSEQIRYQNNTFAINSVSEALDDLYSYSKEKIDSNTSNNYSTEEQVVGTWIDGKPIYQKTVYVGKLPANGTLISANVSSNIDLLIDMHGSVMTTDGSTRQYPIPATNIYDVKYLIEAFLENGKVYVRQNSGDAGVINGDVYMTVQYTKTTDTATS